MKWIKDGLSLDETKVSALIIGFFCTLSMALYQAWHIGDISDNMLMLLAYELGAFAGIKCVESFAFAPGKKKSKSSFSETETENLP
ncbi:hypothetical protein [Paenibacillus alvei]|uniref:hypothetical protein n=1 Tax=Paenibacillus alvei TaxID=44250 RepID=UPI0016573470|nr:hypothetical protein [Paenibacillus alvei]